MARLLQSFLLQPLLLIPTSSFRFALIPKTSDNPFFELAFCRPNPLARAMITGKSKIIGLIVAYLDNQFYPLALEKLSRELQQQGNTLVIVEPSGTLAWVSIVRVTRGGGIAPWTEPMTGHLRRCALLKGGGPSCESAPCI